MEMSVVCGEDKVGLQVNVLDVVVSQPVSQ